ncbi:MAG: dTMP kinase [Desulfuromonadaceae bacterium]|nr:dTMP kinase [Desulfuromonadaceae bacterium]
MSLFITFEGIEGSGKSTQILLLAEKLKALNHAVIVTREPGGCPLADQIRHLLLQPDQGPMAPAAELFLYLAARAQHMQEIILPALEKNFIVLCDRFSDATTAYQGFARGIDPTFIGSLNHFATSGHRPDLTLLFELPAEEGLRRSRRRSHHAGTEIDRLERESLDFHRRVREGYLRLAAGEPDRFRTFDATLTVEEISAAVAAAVIPLLS